AETKWPNRDALRSISKGTQFALHSQTIQAVVECFVTTIDTTKLLRKTHPQMGMRYPWKEKRFYPLMWPAQAVHVEATHIVLPMGRGRKSLVIPRPAGFPDAPGGVKVCWNGAGYDLHVAIEAPAETQSMAVAGVNATVDLGEIHQLAISTNTGKALVVSDRGIRSVKRYWNVARGQVCRLRSRCKKGSKRAKRLGWTISRIMHRTLRQVRDLRHKGTRKAIAFCVANAVSSIYVGDPDGVRKRPCGRKHNQRMSQWEYGKDMQYLDYKSRKAGMECFSGTERGTSSHCPSCGHRHRPKGREWACKKCGFRGHRDVVGAVNMHPLAYGEQIEFPSQITYRRAGITQGTKQPLRSARRSRPDPGLGACGPVLSRYANGPTTQIAGTPQGVGQAEGLRMEAHPL
ncbi:MAG: transposase, partial [Acidobacteria bacterium]|nr:transposase [Acidobacteriota bacterium]